MGCPKLPGHPIFLRFHLCWGISSSRRKQLMGLFSAMLAIPTGCWTSRPSVLSFLVAIQMQCNQWLDVLSMPQTQDYKRSYLASSENNSNGKKNRSVQPGYFRIWHSAMLGSIPWCPTWLQHWRLASHSSSTAAWWEKTWLKRTVDWYFLFAMWSYWFTCCGFLSANLFLFG